MAPNPGHLALVELEKQGRLQCIVTQNVDGLHTAAGSQQRRRDPRLAAESPVSRLRAPTSRPSLKRPVTGLAELPRCPCGGLIRPGVVLFGEPLPEEAY